METKETIYTVDLIETSIDYEAAWKELKNRMKDIGVNMLAHDKNFIDYYYGLLLVIEIKHTERIPVQ